MRRANLERALDLIDELRPLDHATQDILRQLCAVLLDDSDTGGNADHMAAPEVIGQMLRHAPDTSKPELYAPAGNTSIGHAAKLSDLAAGLPFFGADKQIAGPKRRKRK